jgi:elongation factor P--(R)-beta-lysine ligase
MASTAMDSPWWRPDRIQDRLGLLQVRAETLRAVRGYFHVHGFIETDVGALAASPGAEVHTHALHTQAGFLHTSPEFAMKKLLAGGLRRIFYLGKVYRAGEHGPLHAPEFTMLEWYRAQEPYEAVMADAVEIMRLAAKAAGRKTPLHSKDRFCDPFAEPERLSVRQAFLQHTGAAEPADADAFAAVLANQVEPHLGSPALTLLDRYPITEAALAQRSADDPSTAERFELYACGVELANGYGELIDAQEQRARLEQAMAEKHRRYGEAWPLDQDFLSAVGAMPPASGCALGLDRVIMLASGARTLADVVWTPPPI